MDIQHILNTQKSKCFLDNYSIAKGLSVSLESREHFLLSKNRVKSFLSKENFIKDEVQSLIDFTNTPNEIINTIFETINKV